MTTLPYWYYKGRTTTPINIPGVGPIVLTPRMKFHAPQAAVSHLMKQKLVARLPDPPVKEEPVVTPEPEEKSLAAPKSEAETQAEDDSSEPESKDAVIPSQPAEDTQTEGEGAGTSSDQPTEKEEKKGRSTRRRRSGQQRG
jgi:hypothetical protein